MAVDIALSVLINSIPIILAILPYVILRSKTTFRKVYARLLLCFIFFWAFYYILPGLLYDFLFLRMTPLIQLTLYLKFNPLLILDR